MKTVSNQPRLPSFGLRAGFTLLELLVVVALIGFVMAVAIVRLQGPHRRALLMQAVDRVQLVDGQLRRQCRRSGEPAQLEVDLNAGTLRRLDAIGGDHQQGPMIAGTSINIDRYAAVNTTRSSGRFHVTYNVAGRTPTFALRLSAGEDHVRWILFAGTTGQAMITDEEKVIETLLERLAKTRPNLD